MFPKIFQVIRGNKKAVEGGLLLAEWTSINGEFSHLAPKEQRVLQP